AGAACWRWKRRCGARHRKRLSFSRRGRRGGGRAADRLQTSKFFRGMGSLALLTPNGRGEKKNEPSAANLVRPAEAAPGTGGAALAHGAVHAGVVAPPPCGARAGSAAVRAAAARPAALARPVPADRALAPGSGLCRAAVGTRAHREPYRDERPGGGA